MNTSVFRGPILAAAMASLVFASASNAQPAATSPWAKVPALSTACFYGADPFDAKLNAALEAVKASRSRQMAINAKIEEDYKKIDPMEMMSRMQQWMMSNPQEATKYMQEIQAIGNEAQTGIPEDSATQMRFQTEQKDLARRYQAALTQAYAPATARWNALLKKLGITENIPSVKDPGTPQWAMAEEDSILREQDRAYAAVCPQLWGAAGPMHAWLKKYRTWLVQEHIPLMERMESQNAQTFAIMNTPTAAYRSLAAYDGVIKYLEVVGQVFGLRRDAPKCTATECRFV